MDETTSTKGMAFSRALRVIQAHDAAVRRAESAYRMGGMRQPFTMGDQFNHLFPVAESLSLCRAITSPRVRTMPRALLHQVDCLACLDAFTERTRP